MRRRVSFTCHGEIFSSGHVASDLARYFFSMWEILRLLVKIFRAKGISLASP